MAAEAGYGLGCRAVIRGDNLAPFLRVKPRRQIGRIHQVTKEHGQMPSLATAGGGSGFDIRRLRTSDFS